MSEQDRVREAMCMSNPRTDGEHWEPWEGNGPCQDCGRRNVVWFADNTVWNLVMGGKGGLLCPSCFVIRAFDVGLNPVWRLAPEKADMNDWIRARWWIWRHPFKAASVRRYLDKQR